MIWNKKQIILLWAVKSIVGWSLYIADWLHFFEEAWLQVKILRYQNGKEVLEALSNNIIDIAFAWTIPYESMINNDIKYVVRVAEWNDTQIILNANIKDIVTTRSHKKIWIISNTASLKAREAFQNSHNISPKKIQLIEMNSYDMPSNFARGLIDGFVIWEPLVSYARSLLDTTIIIYDKKNDSYTWYMNIFVMNEFYKKQRVLLEKIEKVFFDANKYIKTHKDESIDIIASYTQISPKIITKNWNRYDFYTSY